MPLFEEEPYWGEEFELWLSDAGGYRRQWLRALEQGQSFVVKRPMAGPTFQPE